MQGTQLQRPIKDTLTLEWAERTLTSSKLSPEDNLQKTSTMKFTEQLMILLLWSHIFCSNLFIALYFYVWNETFFVICDLRPSPFILVPPRSLSGCLMRLFPFSVPRLHHPPLYNSTSTVLTIVLALGLINRIFHEYSSCCYGQRV